MVIRTAARAVCVALDDVPVWAWVVAAVIVVYVGTGLLTGYVAVYGWSVWLAVPWDWSLNVDIGMFSHGAWIMFDTL